MFYKVLESNLNHHSFQFKEGLNVDSVPFNPFGDCGPGGLYFTDKINVLNWASQLSYTKVADVTVPDDARVIQGKNKWKADRLILSNIRSIEKFVLELTESELLQSVKQNGRSLQFIKDQTEELCLEAVKQNGMALRFVKDQTVALCIEAVKQNGLALQYVKEQIPMMCLEAVKQDGLALVHVKKQSETICLEAVKQNGRALQYVEDQTR